MFRIAKVIYRIEESKHPKKIIVLLGPDQTKIFMDRRFGMGLAESVRLTSLP